MSCTPPIRTIQTPTLTVFSRGTSAPGESDLFVFTPDSIEGVAPLLFGLRVTITVENATADFKSQAVFQTTSDGKVSTVRPWGREEAEPTESASVLWGLLGCVDRAKPGGPKTADCIPTFRPAEKDECNWARTWACAQRRGKLEVDTCTGECSCLTTDEDGSVTRTKLSG